MPIRPTPTAWLFSSAAVLALLGCEGGGTSPPVTAATPTPSPAPAVTPPATPAPTTDGVENIAGATVGASLEARVACSSATQQISSGGLITGLTSLVPVTLDTATFRMSGSGLYNVELRGVSNSGANTFTRLASTSRFVRFRDLSDIELDIIRTDYFNGPELTYGMINRPPLCFFVAGQAAAPPPASTTNYYVGPIDGLAQTATTTHRLVGGAAIEFSFTTRSGILVIDFFGHANAFADPAGQPVVNLGRATANLVLNGNEVSPTVLTGPAGYTGTVTGQLMGTSSLALVFEVRNAAGHVTWGTAALRLGSPWDY